ncbi:RHS repeat-associated core domain-containing protein [Facilibium subflavum]|uniref:RHS repeat-associated core domain-containing protein n=1 Tax=Facilibium subflavum TaxID=2219058 RepID=UPI000E646567|nr:RHS repeat-associated core domain-containing protein [Facilibium subflavum]
MKQNYLSLLKTIIFLVICAAAPRINFAHPVIAKLQHVDFYLTNGKSNKAMLPGSNEFSTSQQKLSSTNYTAYGKGQKITNAKGFGYNKEYTDENSNLMYLRARFYHPATQTFITRDTKIDEWNKYGFTGGNLVMNIDPSGHDKEEENLDNTPKYFPQYLLGFAGLSGLLCLTSKTNIAPKLLYESTLPYMHFLNVAITLTDAAGIMPIFNFKSLKSITYISYSIIGLNGLIMLFNTGNRLYRYIKYINSEVYTSVRYLNLKTENELNEILMNAHRSYNQLIEPKIAMPKDVFNIIQGLSVDLNERTMRLKETLEKVQISDNAWKTFSGKLDFSELNRNEKNIIIDTYRRGKRIDEPRIEESIDEKIFEF